MTTLPNRPNTALIVLDVQNGVVAEAYDRDNVVARIATLVDNARAAGVDVVWVQYHGDNVPRDSEAWQYVPELVRRDSEPLVHKRYADAFEETGLYWSNHTAPGRTGGTVDTSEVDFTATA